MVTQAVIASLWSAALFLGLALVLGSFDREHVVVGICFGVFFGMAEYLRRRKRQRSTIER